MKVKFWCGEQSEVIELLAEMTKQEVIDYFHEWLEQKADAGFDLLEGVYADHDDVPLYLRGTKDTEDAKMG